MWSSPIHALDLLQVYQAARKNDVQYQAALARFQADSVSKQLGLARSLPQLSYNYRWMHNDYRSDQQTLSFPNDLDSQLQACQSASDVLACLVNSLTGVEIQQLKSTFTSSESNLTLTQVLFDADVNAERVKGRAFALKAAAEMALAEKQLMLRVLNAYLDVLQTQEKTQLLSQQLTLLQQQQQIAQKRLVLGVGNEVTVIKTNVAVNNQQLLVQSSLIAQQSAHTRLAQMTQLPTALLQVFSSHFSGESLLPAVDESYWLQQAFAHNDGIKIAEAIERLAQQEVTKNQLTRLPKITVAANYNDRKLNGGSDFRPASNSTIVGIDITLPLYHGGALFYAKKQASYHALEAKDNVLLQKQQTQLAVSQLLLVLQHDVSQQHSLQQTIATIETTLATIQQAYQNGADLWLDQMELQKELFIAKGAESEIRFQFMRHLFEFKLATGLLALQDMQTINQWLVTQ